MQVAFHKTGERRYGVIIRRDGLPDLEMNPAPGFDPLMPHDMLHFLVEQELGICQGIYGQLASGGTAGTFHEAASGQAGNRTDSRQRRKTAQRGKKLLKENIEDCARSERATYICLTDWLAHSPDAGLQARAAEMKANADSTTAQMSETERAMFSVTKLVEIRSRMDELSRQWAALKIGELMSIEW